MALAALATHGATRKGVSGPDSVLFNRVYAYADSTRAIRPDSLTYAYSRFSFSTDRRNILLMAVPTMYGVARGDVRQFAGEFINKIKTDSTGNAVVERVAEVNTIRHGRSALSVVTKFLAPKIYDETIFEGYLLSPFHPKNHRFYKFRFIHLDTQRTRITFKPRADNTQLVSGRATIDNATGRITETDLYGEFDMIRFRLSVEMGKVRPLPLRCKLLSKFEFLGSKISAIHAIDYGIAPPHSLPADKTLSLPETEALMNQIRPEPLPENERKIIEAYYRDHEEQEARRAADTIVVVRKKDFAQTIWNAVGTPFINRYKSSFGPNDEGSLRINPILNPLYFGYSNSKGIVYKFDIRMGYQFTPNRDITMRLKSGYSFKLRQLYFSIPVRFNYNKRRNAFVALNIDHGHHLYNSEIAADFPTQLVDSLQSAGLRLDYFRDTRLNLYNNYDLSDYWSFNVGLSFHRRQGITRKAFELVGLPSLYRSTAPRLELQYRPLGWKGPALTLDYERGIKGFLGSDADFERWEFDASYIHVLPRLRSVSMRFGSGVYTKKGSQRYFLDFSNFRQNNLSGGWNDDWSGDFELLRSAWYNSSRYYVRTNATYSSPLMLTSWLPWVGHFVEMERVYLGAVIAEELRPYAEVGYGFTTRWVSVAAFVGSRNGRFERIGFAFGFELFRRW